MEIKSIKYNQAYNKTTPRVSIVIPIYNRASTIVRTMDSLKLQSYKNYECILVDDGSTDEIDNIIYQHIFKRDIPILYIKKENGGVHTARNIAISKARGELTMFLDSDDEFVPNAIQIMVDAWNRIPSNEKHVYREVVAQCIDQNGKLVGDSFPSIINDVSHEESIKLCDKTAGEHVAIMVTKTLKDNPWPEPEGITLVTEDVVWKKLEKEYRSYYINDIVRVYYTDTKDSYTNTKRSIQYCKNIHWNVGYMLNNWSVYKSAKTSRIKTLLIYGVFDEVLRNHGVLKTYRLNNNINKVLIILFSIPIKIVARRYDRKVFI